MVIETTGKIREKITVQVRHIRDRYERGISAPGGRPSKDWQTNGEHKSNKGIPSWLKKLAENSPDSAEEAAADSATGDHESAGDEVRVDKTPGERKPVQSGNRGNIPPDNRGNNASRNGGDEYTETFNFFKSHSRRSGQITNEQESRDFYQKSTSRQWIYLIRFSETVYASGTQTNSGDRLRKSSFLNSKLTGKYDRRVDYLMLRAIHGQPEIWLFEIEGDAETVEQQRRKKFYGHTRRGSACFRGFANNDRESISKEIYQKFKKTQTYGAMSEGEQDKFNDFFVNFFWPERCTLRILQEHSTMAISLNPTF